MNNISSKDCAVECLRETERPDTFEYRPCAHKTKREASTIYFGWIGSRQPRTPTAFSVFDAKWVPPVTVLLRRTSLGSSASMSSRSSSGVGTGQ